MKFEKLGHFKTHAISHDPEEVEKKKRKKEAQKIIGGFPCMFCPLKFNRDRTLKAHESLFHKDGKAEKRFKCETCGKGLRDEKS